MLPTPSRGSRRLYVRFTEPNGSHIFRVSGWDEDQNRHAPGLSRDVSAGVAAAHQRSSSMSFRADSSSGASMIAVPVLTGPSVGPTCRVADAGSRSTPPSAQVLVRLHVEPH